jgi:multidrug efflux pump subunit AcrB
MKYLPITLMTTLGASLLMALVFIPTLGALVGRPSHEDETTRRRLAVSESGDLQLEFTDWQTRPVGKPVQLELSASDPALLPPAVERRPAPKEGTLNRTDGRRILSVKADVPEGVLPDTQVRRIQAWVEEQADWNPLVEVAFKGEDEEQRESKVFLSQAFGVALFIMAIILVTQFNSFYQALLILSAVVFSTVGVLLGLLTTGLTFATVLTLVLTPSLLVLGDRRRKHP